MKNLTMLLICLVAVALFCAGCGKDEKKTPAADPNAQVTSSQNVVVTQNGFLLNPDIMTCQIVNNTIYRLVISENRQQSFVSKVEGEDRVNVCGIYFAADDEDLYPTCRQGSK